MIKAVFFDVDGTLLDFKTHKIPDSTIESLSLLKQKGIKTFISTGRNVSSLGELDEMDFDGYITSNGQYCVVDDILIHEQVIDPEDIRNLVDWLEGQDSPIPITFYANNGCYTNVKNGLVESLHKNINIPAPIILPADEILKCNIYQISPYILAEDEPDFLMHMPNCKAVRWNEAFADVIPKSGSKANGIDKVLKYLGIPLEQSMAFGDGGNDIDMLIHAGIGVAMGNAEKEVKTAADHVTTHIMDNGVYNALKNYKVI